MDRTRSASRRKSEGAHYTPIPLAAFVAAQIVRAWRGDLNKPLSILDPAVGDGALLVELLKALQAKGALKVGVAGFDTSSEALGRAQLAIEAVHPRNPAGLRAADFLDVAIPVISGQDSLFDEETVPKERFDMVIANPPYVRTQVMGAERSQQLAATFGLSGRVDLYFAFIRAIGQVLKPEGVAGIIVSNRFMTTQSGMSLRESIRHDFDILDVYDFGDTRLFEAAVLPAVLVLRRRCKDAPGVRAGYASIYSSRTIGKASESDDVFSALDRAGHHRLPSGDVFEVKRGALDVGDSPTAIWRLATAEGDSWLAQVESRTAMRFSDIGPIRVGIKTTADKIFIRSDWGQMPEGEQPELLRPIITHHGATRFRSATSSVGPKVLYTHETRDGRRTAVQLSDFPRSARYLARHRAHLEARTYVRDAGRKWYEIWVPQDPDAWRLPKLVFRDISEEPMFWIDLEGSIVNGDCYWLAVDEKSIDLLYLAAAVGNSTFVEAFYDHRFNNKLYAGRRRFITQYVSDFPLPDPSSAVALKMVALSKKLATAVSGSSETARLLDALTWEAFGLSGEEVTR